MIDTFTSRQMQKITGQRMLPQSIFRSFLEELNDVISSLLTSAEKADSAYNATSSLDLHGAVLRVDGDAEKLYINIKGNEYEIAFVEPQAEVLQGEE